MHFALNIVNYLASMGASLIGGSG